MHPKPKKDGLQATKLNQNIFHQVMPVHQFVEEYYLLTNLEQKIDLLKAQFPEDIFTRDLSILESIKTLSFQTNNPLPISTPLQQTSVLSSTQFNITGTVTSPAFQMSPRLKQSTQQQQATQTQSRVGSNLSQINAPESAQIGQQPQLISITFEQMEQCLFVIQDIIYSVINQFEEQDFSSNNRMGLQERLKVSVLQDQISKIQWIIVLCVDKLYGDLLRSEFFDSAHFDQERILIMQNGYDILGDIVFYLLEKQPNRLNAYFLEFVRERLALCLKTLVKTKETDLLDRQKIVEHQNQINQLQQSSSFLKPASSNSKFSHLQANNGSGNLAAIMDVVQHPQSHQRRDSGELRTTIFQRKLSAEEVNERNATFLMKKQIFRNRTKQLDSVVAASSKERNNPFSKSANSNQNQWWQSYLQEKHLLEDDKTTLESLFLSIIRIANALFKHYSSLPILEKLMEDIYFPLMKCSTIYQNIFLDSHQDITLKIRLRNEVHELSESSQIMVNSRVGYAVQDFSLQTLLLKSVDKQLLKLREAIQNQRLGEVGVNRMQSFNPAAANSKSQKQKQKETNRVNKGATIASKNDMQAQNSSSILQSQDWLKRNQSKLSILLDQMANLQFYHYILQIEGHNTEPEREARFKEQAQQQQEQLRSSREKQELQKRAIFLGSQIEQRRVATPTIKRKKTLGMLNIKSNLQLGKKDPNSLSQKTSMFVRKPSDETQSPSVFIKRLVGSSSAGLLGSRDFQAEDEETKTPLDKFKNEPLNIERINNQLNTSTQKKKDFGQSPNLVNEEEQKAKGQLQQQHKKWFDPFNFIRGESVRKDEMNIQSLVFSSTKLLKSEKARADWIRRSQCLLELLVNFLKESFCVSSDLANSQKLFHRMMELFKVTLFFICQFKHQMNLFHNNYEDLTDIIYLDSMPCPLIHTYQIMMQLVPSLRDQQDFFEVAMNDAGSSVNKQLQDLFMIEYIDLLRYLTDKGSPFELVDNGYTARIYYLTFFEQCISRVDVRNKLYESIPSLLTLVKIWQYPEEKMGLIEINEPLRLSKTYSSVKTKMIDSSTTFKRYMRHQQRAQGYMEYIKAVEEAKAQPQIAPSQRKNTVSEMTSNLSHSHNLPSLDEILKRIETNLNQILFFQLIFSCLLELGHLQQSFFDRVFREVSDTLISENSVDINSGKLYTHLKLLILLLRPKDQLSNVEVFQILTPQEDQELMKLPTLSINDYKPWTLSTFCGQNGSKLNSNLWEQIISKLEKFIDFEKSQQYQKSKEKPKNIQRNVEMNPNTIITRNQSEIKSMNKSSASSSVAPINLKIFGFYSKFLTYSLQNEKIMIILMKQVSDDGRPVPVDPLSRANNQIGINSILTETSSRSRQQYSISYQYNPSNSIFKLCSRSLGEDSPACFVELRLKLIFFSCIASDKELSSESEVLKTLPKVLEYVAKFIISKMDLISQINSQRDGFIKQRESLIEAQRHHHYHQQQEGLSARQRLQNKLDVISNDISEIDKKTNTLTFQLRNLVNISVKFLGNYVLYKQFKSSGDQLNIPSPLNLVKQSAFFTQVLLIIKKIALTSSQNLHIFTEQLLMIYFYKVRESPYIISSFDYWKNSEIEIKRLRQQSYLPKILSFLFITVQELAMNKEKKHEKDKTLLNFDKLISTIHQQAVEYLSAQGIQALRLSKYVGVQIIKSLKHIMIALREEFPENMILIHKLKQIVERIIQFQTNPHVMREFFAFLREIFYYKDDMDEVDNNLAQDVLEILNNMLKNKSESDPSYNSALGINQRVHQNMAHSHFGLQSQTHRQKGKGISQNFSPADFFYFSDQTPGIVSQERLSIISDSTFYVSFLYKVDLCQLRKFRQNGQDDLVMTLIHFKQVSNIKDDQRVLDPLNSPKLQLIVIDNSYYKLYCNQGLDRLFEFDDKWHLVVMKFEERRQKGQYRISLFHDDFALQQDMVVDVKVNMQAKNTNYFIALGCEIEQVNEVSSSPSRFRNPFLGRMSLPFAFAFNMEKLNMDQREIILKQFVQHSIEKKLVLQLTITNLFDYLKRKRDLTQKEQKDLLKETFQSWDEFNELFINLHKVTQDMNLCCSVHQTRPSLTFVGLGGFKLMYPLFEKSLDSNMSKAQKSHVWKHLFRILRTLMNVEPSHVHRLYKNKNLIDILKYCLIRGGQKGILTKELIQDVLKIFQDLQRNNTSKSELQEFYSRYLLDILLYDKFCALPLKPDEEKKLVPMEQESQYSYIMPSNEDDNEPEERPRFVYEEVVETIFGMYTDQSQMKELKAFSIFDLVNTNTCLDRLETLINKFKDLEFEDSNSKIATIMARIILRNDDAESFKQILKYLQGQRHAENKRRENRGLLKVKLQIVDDILKNAKTSYKVIQKFTGEYRKEAYLEYISLLRDPETQIKLDEQKTLKGGNFEDLIKNQVINDKIAALSFKIVYTANFMQTVIDYRSRMPDRVQVNVYTSGDTSSIETSKREKNELLIREILDAINPISERHNKTHIKMQRTLCTMLLSCYERSQQMTKHYAYNPESLIKFSKQQKEFLKLMESPDFDKYLFDKLRDLFPKFDFDTKSLYLNFLNQGFDLQVFGNEYESLLVDDDKGDKDKNFVRRERDNLFDRENHLKLLMKQEQTIKEIVKMTVQIEEKEILEFGERIVQQVCRAYLEQNTMHIDKETYDQLKFLLNMDSGKGYNIKGDKGKQKIFTEGDARFLNLIKLTFWCFDGQYQSQLRILKDVVRRIEEMLGKRPMMQENNQVNLCIKVITFLQLIEEFLFRQNKQEKEATLRDPESIHILGKFILILTELDLLYFEYPYCKILEIDRPEPSCDLEKQKKNIQKDLVGQVQTLGLENKLSQAAGYLQMQQSFYSTQQYSSQQFTQTIRQQPGNNLQFAQTIKLESSDLKSARIIKVNQIEESQIQFVEGGALRIVLSLLLQVIRVSDITSIESFEQAQQLLRFILFREESNTLFELQRQSVFYQQIQAQKLSEDTNGSSSRAALKTQQPPLITKYMKQMIANSEKGKFLNAKKQSIKNIVKQEIARILGKQVEEKANKFQKVISFVLSLMTYEFYDIIRKRQSRLSREIHKLKAIPSDHLSRRQIIENHLSQGQMDIDREYFGIPASQQQENQIKAPSTRENRLKPLRSEYDLLQSKGERLKKKTNRGEIDIDRLEEQETAKEVTQNVQEEDENLQFDEGYSERESQRILYDSPISYNRQTNRKISHQISHFIKNQAWQTSTIKDRLDFESRLQYDLLRFIFDMIYRVQNLHSDLECPNVKEFIQAITHPQIKENLQYHVSLYEENKEVRMAKGYVLGRLYCAQNMQRWPDIGRLDIQASHFKQSMELRRSSKNKEQSEDNKTENLQTYESSSEYSDDKSRRDDDEEANQIFLRALEPSEDFKLAEDNSVQYESENINTRAFVQRESEQLPQSKTDRNEQRMTKPQATDQKIQNPQNVEEDQRQSQIYLDSIFDFIFKFYSILFSHFDSPAFSAVQTPDGGVQYDENFLESFKQEFLWNGYAVEMFRVIGKTFSNKMRSSIIKVLNENKNFPENENVKYQRAKRKEAKRAEKIAHRLKNEDQNRPSLKNYSPSVIGNQSTMPFHGLMPQQAKIQSSQLMTPRLQAQKGFTTNPKQAVTNLGSSQHLPQLRSPNIVLTNRDLIEGGFETKVDYAHIFENYNQNESAAGGSDSASNHLMLNQLGNTLPQSLNQFNKMQSSQQALILTNKALSKNPMAAQSQTDKTKRSGSPDSQLNAFEFESEDRSSLAQINIHNNEKSPLSQFPTSQKQKAPNSQSLLKKEPAKQKLKGIFEILSEKERGSHRTLHYYYTKYQYRKLVKRLEQDPSSLWYDNLEQVKKDYSDLKEIYDLVCLPPKPSSSNQEELKSDRSQVQPLSSRRPANIEEEKKDTHYKQGRQYDHFVRQRRNFDTWGRMMLLKPDRKYKRTKFWLTHMYFVHDFLRSIFAVGFLDDEDFSDAQPISREMTNLQKDAYINLKTQELRQLQESSQGINTQDASESEQLDLEKRLIEEARNQPHSVQFQQLREMLLRKVEQNDFLYNLLMNPHLVIPRNNANQFENQESNKFEFHEVNKSDGTSGGCSGIKITKGLDFQVQEFAVQYIAVEGQYYGSLYLSCEFVMFKSKFDIVDPNKFPFSEVLDHQLVKKEKIWHFSEIEQIFKRRFLLVDQACEIFTKEKKSYFFNFLEPEPCAEFFSYLDKVRKLFSSTTGLEIIENSVKDFSEKNFKHNWLHGSICNEQFLMLVNKYSGRSFNDLNQYPIFPWVIKNYSSPNYDTFKDELDKDGLRDLTKHTGVLSEAKKSKAEETYNKEIEDDGFNLYGLQKHHLKFGYSNKMFTLGYLIRLEPFTDSFIQVNQNLDNPDRLVYSIDYQYHGVENDTQNNSELTPEYFYLPEILRNHNLNHFGRNRDGVCVNEIILPPWANGSEHNFIRINREVLNSKQVSQTLLYWLDLMFGEKQRSREHGNVFFQFAYEEYVKVRENREKMDRAKVDTIREFMQVPRKLFNKSLYTLKNQKEINNSVAGPNLFHPAHNKEYHSQQITSNTNKQIQQQQLQEELEQENEARMQQQLALEQQRELQNTKKEGGGMMGGWFKSKHKAGRGTNALEGHQMMSKDLDSSQDKIICLSSLIRIFMQDWGVKAREHIISKIAEPVKYIKETERQVVFMQFHMSKLMVFLTDKTDKASSNWNPYVKVVARSNETFSSEDLKDQVNTGLRYKHIKGRDLTTVFQATFVDKKVERIPLLFSCMHLDNTIKVFDLNVKKNKPALVYQEAINNAMVTVIKFGSEGKVFITGDADGMIHHYTQRTNEDKEAQSSALASSAPLLSLSEQNPNFPYILKVIFCILLKVFQYKIQDHLGAILGIDINETLDMYVTASADGKLQLRCLRTSQLWKVIQCDVLLNPTIKIQSLKLSLHGYIVLICKYTQTYISHSNRRDKEDVKSDKKQGIIVYSINGDLLQSLEKHRYKFRVKYVQLTEGEDQMIVVTNQSQDPEDKDKNPKMCGCITLFRLYDFTYEGAQNHLERFFYSIVTREKELKKGSTQLSQNKYHEKERYLFMPLVKSFALTKNESKMNIFLETQQLICFDESKQSLHQQLGDFGLMNYNF